MEPFDVHGQNIVLVPLSANDAADLTDALQDPVFSRNNVDSLSLHSVDG